jgi:predicted XRE-type DNA-binding protein
MTGLTNVYPSLVAEIEEDPVLSRELAASRLTHQAVQLLNLALEMTAIPQKKLAGMLNIGESRVSQVVKGDGNLKLTTFARYMRALGYKVRFTVEPAVPGVPNLERPRRTRVAKQTDVVKITYSRTHKSEKFSVEHEFEPDTQLPSVAPHVGFIQLDKIPSFSDVKWTEASQAVAS